MRVQHAPGQHLPSCTGPDNCEEFLSVLGMAATTPEIYRRFLIDDSARQLAARRGLVRSPIAPVDDYTPPDPYGIVWPD